MSDRSKPQPNIDDQRTIQLERLRSSIDDALAQFAGDAELRRGLIQAAGAIDQRLGRPKELLSRRERRHGGPR